MNRLINKVNKKASFGGATMMLIIVALVGQMLGFFRNRLISANFTRIDPGSTDAYFAAFQIPDFFYLTIAAGAVGVALLPFLSDRLAKGDRKTLWETVSGLFNLLGLAMLVVAVVVFVFARPLLHYVVAPKLDPHQLDQAVTIMRIVALNPLFFTLSGLLTSAQQAFGRFFFFAVAPLFYNIAIIASVYIFKDSLGVVGLGLGALAGALAQFLIATIGLKGLGFKWKPKVSIKTGDIKPVLQRLPARSIDQGIDSINSIVETNRATLLGKGPVSYYNFAVMLMNVPVMLFGTAISTVAFPRLTARLAQGRPDLFHKEFFKVLRLMIWISMPVVVVSYFARGYIARLLFGDVAPEVALIFGFLSIAILFRIIYTLVSRYFYAQKDTKTPLFVSLFAIGLNIFLVFNLARPGAYGIAGLALAQSITVTVEVVMLFLIMFVRDRYLLNRAFWGSIVRIISVTGFSVIAAFIMVSLFPLEIGDRGIATLGIKFAAIAGGTMLVHVLMSYLFGLDEPKPVIHKIRQLIFKPIKL